MAAHPCSRCLLETKHVNDEATIEKLVNDNLALAYWVVEKYASRLERWMDRDEITSNAMLGLFDAAREFDAAKGFTFSTFARYHFRNRILRPLAYLEKAKRGGLYVQHLHLDAPIGEDGDVALHEIIPDNRGEEDPSRLLEERTKVALAKVLPKLRPHHQQIIMLRFGLGGMPELNLEQVGDYLGVTRERVRQIEKAALLALRYLMAKEMKVQQPVKHE